MDDDGRLRDLLRDAVPPVGADEIEAALARAHTGAESRRRPAWVQARRTWAPVAVAGLTAAIVVAVLLVGRGTGHSRAPVGRPPVTGTWFRHVELTVDTPTGPVALQDVVLVHLRADGTGTIEVRGTGGPGSSPLRRLASGNWQTRVLGTYCGSGSAAYRIDVTRPALTFTAVADGCSARRAVLDSAVFARLTSPDQLTG